MSSHPEEAAAAAPGPGTAAVDASVAGASTSNLNSNPRARVKRPPRNPSQVGHIRAPSSSAGRDVSTPTPSSTTAADGAAAATPRLAAAGSKRGAQLNPDAPPFVPNATSASDARLNVVQRGKPARPSAASSSTQDSAAGAESAADSTTEPVSVLHSRPTSGPIRQRRAETNVTTAASDAAPSPMVKSAIQRVHRKKNEALHTDNSAALSHPSDASDQAHRHQSEVESKSQRTDVQRAAVKAVRDSARKEARQRRQNRVSPSEDNNESSVVETQEGSERKTQPAPGRGRQQRVSVPAAEAAGRQDEPNPREAQLGEVVQHGGQAKGKVKQPKPTVNERGDTDARAKRERKGKAPQSEEKDAKVVIPECFLQFTSGAVSASAQGEELDRLRAQLLQLQRDELECTVCIEKINRTDATWNCQQCHHIFHLRCMQDWFTLRFQRAAQNAAASAAIATASRSSQTTRRGRERENDQLALARAARQAAANATANLPSSFADLLREIHRLNQDTSWPCPHCTVQVSTPPAKYVCYCGQTENPRANSMALPHGCLKTCNKPLGAPGTDCPHRCVLQCHPGPCPPCPAMGNPRPCACGRSTYVLRCGRLETKPRSCGQVCGKSLRTAQEFGSKECGHSCTKLCHVGPCPPCSVSETQSCFCGREQNIERPCGSSYEFANALDTSGEKHFSCGSVCNKQLECGNHRCLRVCHPGACEPCKYMSHSSCACGKTSVNELDAKTVYDHLTANSELRQRLEKHQAGRSGPEGVDELTMEQKVEILMKIRTCLEPLPVCTKTCGRKLPNCEHFCRRPCHEDECGDCTDPGDEVRCRCQREVVRRFCPESAEGKRLMQRQRSECLKQAPDAPDRAYISFFDPLDPRNANAALQPMNFPQDMATCSSLCRQVLSCGLHRCNSRCCPDATGFPIAGVVLHFCPRKCNKMCGCGRHRCGRFCHGSKPCPPCNYVYSNGFTCPCGAQSIPGRIRCVDVQAHCDPLCGLEFNDRLPRMRIRYGSLSDLWLSSETARKVKPNDTSIAPRPPFVGPHWADFIPHPPNYLMIPSEPHDATELKAVEHIAETTGQDPKTIVRSRFPGTSPAAIPGSGNDGAAPCTHRCTDKLSKDTCSPCCVIVAKWCIGGHGRSLAVECGMPRPSCGEVCRRKLPCGHECLRTCHGGPCLAPSTIASTLTAPIATPTSYSLPSIEAYTLAEKAAAGRSASDDESKDSPPGIGFLDLAESVQPSHELKLQKPSDEAIAQLMTPGVREESVYLDPALRPIAQFSNTLTPSLPASYSYTRESYIKCAQSIWERGGVITSLTMPAACPTRDVVICCARPCGKPKPACSHKCKLPCHPGIQCPSAFVPCKEYILRKCLCGRIEQREPCSLLDRHAAAMVYAPTPAEMQEFVAWATEAKSIREAGFEVKYVERTDDAKHPEESNEQPIPNDSWDDGPAQPETLVKAQEDRSLTRELKVSKAYIEYLTRSGSQSPSEEESHILSLPESVVPIPCDADCFHRKRLKALASFVMQSSKSYASSSTSQEHSEEMFQNPYPEDVLARIESAVSLQFVVSVQEVFAAIVNKTPIPPGNHFVNKQAIALAHAAAAAAATASGSELESTLDRVEQELENVKSQSVASQVVTSFMFPAMNKTRRSVVHQLASYYNLYSVSLDPEPHRAVRVERTPQAQVPVVLVSRVLEMRERQAAQVRSESASRSSQALQAMLSKPPTPRYAMYIYDLIAPGMSADEAVAASVLGNNQAIISIRDIQDMLLPWEDLYAVTSIMRHTALVRVGTPEVLDEIIKTLTENSLLQRVAYRPTSHADTAQIDAFVMKRGDNYLWFDENFKSRYATPQMHAKFVTTYLNRRRAINNLKAMREAAQAAASELVPLPPSSSPETDEQVDQEALDDPEFARQLAEAKRASLEDYEVARYRYE